MHRAGVAEWQTRRTQNPLVARPCGFDSLLRHHNSSARLNHFSFIRRVYRARNRNVMGARSAP
jgi:hypothetical protein